MVGENEIWKDIEGFPNYQISNYGRIKSKERWVTNAHRTYLKSEQILKTYVMKGGYVAIVLRDNNGKTHLFKIHRLVAEYFIPNPNNYPVINHIDGDKTNYSVDNLEWCTVKQNTDHAIANGLKPLVTGGNIQKVYKLDADTLSIIDCYDNFAEASRKNEMPLLSIYAAAQKLRFYNGFFWAKEDNYANAIEHNLFRKPRNSTRFNITPELCKSLREQGMSTKNIALKLNCSESLIERRLKKK